MIDHRLRKSVGTMPNMQNTLIHMIDFLLPPLTKKPAAKDPMINPPIPTLDITVFHWSAVPSAIQPSC